MKPINYYVGIDPGANGGIVAIDPNSHVVVHERCPSSVHDLDDIYRHIASLQSNYDNCNIKAIIESVHSMPGNSGRSMFSFGTNYGMHLGLLASNKIPFTKCTPAMWMKHYGTMPRNKTQRKNHIKSLAQQLHPNINKVTLATSDAILIAHYCMVKGTI